MLICNGCSKSGTHLLTAIAEHIGREQIGGTLIYRCSSVGMRMKGETPLDQLLAARDDRFVHAHVICDETSREAFRGHHHLFILRHPRNVAISWMRHRNKENSSVPLSPESLAHLIRCGMMAKSVPDYYRKFLPWVEQDGVVACRYEDLNDLKSPVYKILYQYLGEDFHKHKTFLLGGTSTWTGSPSDWSSSPYWTREVDRAWKEAGGLELEKEAGY